MKKLIVLFILLIASNCFAFSPSSMMQMGTSYTDVALTYSGATHTEGQCTAAGGTVISTVGGTVCKFTASSAPSGWTQADNWSTTTQGSAGCSSAFLATGTLVCWGVLFDYTAPAVSATVYTSNHSWNNTVRESNTYYYWPDAGLTSSLYCNPSGGDCESYTGTKTSTSYYLCGTSTVSVDSVTATISSPSRYCTKRVTYYSGGYYQYISSATVYATITEIGCK